MDPLLRQSIWQHLVTLTQTEKITVIITTHYIEEARQANVVGLMRRGRLLAENSPEDLLLEHSLETLEEVFLKLCMSDSSMRAAALAGGSHLSTVAIENLQKSESNGNVSKAGNGISKFSSSYSIYSTESVNPTTVSTVNLVPSHKDRFKALPVADTPGAKQKREKRSLSLDEWWSTTTALFWKNCTRLRRNIPVLLFQFALPAIQVILFCICIGADPFNIPVAIVNEEQPPFLSKLFLDKLDPYLVQQVSGNCADLLARDFLTRLPFPLPLFPSSSRQNNFTNVTEAIDAVKRGEMWGVLHIKDRFSLNLQKRYACPGVKLLAIIARVCTPDQEVAADCL